MSEVQSMSEMAKPTQRPLEQVIQVSRRDLPLSCPLPGAEVWNMHPRVYLPIEDEPSGESVCPYCGARYVLIEDEGS